MSTNATELSGAIRGCRQARRMSQQRLAELAGCSLSMIRLLESGYQPEASAVIDRIEAVFAQEKP